MSQANGQSSVLSQAAKELPDCVRKDCIHGDDGYMIYWPSPSGGSLNAQNLRQIADYLGLANAEWNAIVQNDPRIGGKHGPST